MWLETCDGNWVKSTVVEFLGVKKEDNKKVAVYVVTTSGRSYVLSYHGSVEDARKVLERLKLILR